MSLLDLLSTVLRSVLLNPATLVDLRPRLWSLSLSDLLSTVLRFVLLNPVFLFDLRSGLLGSVASLGIGDVRRQKEKCEYNCKWLFHLRFSLLCTPGFRSQGPTT